MLKQETHSEYTHLEEEPLEEIISDRNIVVEHDPFGVPYPLHEDQSTSSEQSHHSAIPSVDQQASLPEDQTTNATVTDQPLRTEHRYLIKSGKRVIELRTLTLYGCICLAVCCCVR